MVEEGTLAAATPSDVAESSRRAGGAGSQPSEEIPVGEPIVPLYNGLKALPFARLLHQELTRSRVIASWRRLGNRLLPLSTIMVSSLKIIRS